LSVPSHFPYRPDRQLFRVQREGEERIVRTIGLQEDFAFAVAARAPGHLGDELEGPFLRAEIGDPQPCVRVQNAHHVHLGEVMAFGHHLGPDQKLLLAPPEVLQDPLRPADGGSGIAIEARDPGPREDPVQPLLHLLDAAAHVQPILAAASQADIYATLVDASRNCFQFQPWTMVLSSIVTRTSNEYSQSCTRAMISSLETKVPRHASRGYMGF